MSLKRPHELNLDEHVISMPCYFPSISSIKTNLSPLSYLQVLCAVEYPLFLISAYDIHQSIPGDQEKIHVLLKNANNKGELVLLDSGNYESYWKKDNSWNIERYRSILRLSSHTVAFAYDFQNPLQSPHEITEVIVKQVYEDRGFSSNGLIVPIIHGNKSNLAEIIFDVAIKTKPVMVAIPERILGDGIIERAKRVLEIRKKLNESGRYYPLHLLGTGNPRSILLYAICGADSFDGLEWCQTTVDHNTGLLYHFQQRELFGEQSPFCKLQNFPYGQATLGHNLLFYQTWMGKLHQNLKDDNLLDLAKEYFPRELLNKLNGYLNVNL
jgi:hypothetical protein